MIVFYTVELFGTCRIALHNKYTRYQTLKKNVLFTHPTWSYTTTLLCTGGSLSLSQCRHGALYLCSGKHLGLISICICVLGVHCVCVLRFSVSVSWGYLYLCAEVFCFCVLRFSVSVGWGFLYLCTEVFCICELWVFCFCVLRFSASVCLGFLYLFA